MYSRYANIYKDHAAERYARAIDASRQGKGGIAAYRRRVVAASMDAQRYRGYVEIMTPGDALWQQGSGAALGPLSGEVARVQSSSPASSRACWQGFGNGDGGGSSVPSEFSVSPASRESARNCSMPSNAAGRKEEWHRDDGALDVWLRDGASECLAEEEICPMSGSFVDAVPFNNIRAKYLRPLDDTELSRPYHVDPSPDWRAESAAGSRSLGGSSASATTNVIVETAGSALTMKSYRKIKQRDSVLHQRHGRTLNWKQRKEWGAH